MLASLTALRVRVPSVFSKFSDSGQANALPLEWHERMCRSPDVMDEYGSRVCVGCLVLLLVQYFMNTFEW